MSRTICPKSVEVLFMSKVTQCLALAGLLVIIAPATLCLSDGVSYDDNASGDWNNNNTWLPNTGYPGSNDTAVIDGYTVRIPSGFVVDSFAAAEVRVNGTINNDHGTVACPVTMQGGSLASIDSYYTGTITVETNALFSTRWDFRLNAPIIGAHKVLFSDSGEGGSMRGFRMNTPNPGWSGGAELLQCEVYWHNSVSTGMGTGPITVNTGAWLRVEGSGNISIPGGVYLNGGSIRGNGQGGTLGYTDAEITLLADSAVGDWYWQDYSFNGHISGNYTLTLYAGGTREVWLNNPMNSFNGLIADGGNCRLKVPGSQGTGTVTVMSGTTLTLDASPDQDWTFTNDISGFGTVQVEEGAATTEMLTVTAGTVSPGGDSGIGTLTVNGRLALAADGTNRSILRLSLEGTNDCDQLKVNGDVVSVDGQILTVRISDDFRPDSDDDIFILLNGGANNGIDGVFWGLQEGATVQLGSCYMAKISYVGNGDAGPLANDIKLYDFGPSGTIILVR